MSARRDKEHQTVIDLIKPEDQREGLYPVGRLDRDTEGLVLITNNGPLGFAMLHPRYHVAKTYYVEVNDILGPDAPAFFESGVVFEDGTICQSAQLEILSSASDKSCARITISEGKFHQVKKMFLAYGVKVTYLKRISFGEFKLDEGMAVGSYRALTEAEKAILRTYLGLALCDLKCDRNFQSADRSILSLSLNTVRLITAVFSRGISKTYDIP